MDAFAEIDAAFPWFFPTVVGVFGAVVGSFLNVCIYRIPAERSVVTPRSTCACGTPIAWYDNIPILSWLILRGRARCCGRRFSIRYPLIELLTAILFLLCWLEHPPAKALCGMLFTAMLICASFIDLDHMIIPDRFSIGAAVIGVVLSGLVPSLHDIRGEPEMVARLAAVIESVLGWLIGAGLIITIGQLAEVILRKDAMGLGDVKLVGAIGAFFGWQGAVFSVFGGAVLGTIGLGLMLLVQAVRRKPSIEDTPKQGTLDVGLGREVPFGPMLAAGGLVYFLALHPIVDAYFGSIAGLLQELQPAW